MRWRIFSHLQIGLDGVVRTDQGQLCHSKWVHEVECESAALLALIPSPHSVAGCGIRGVFCCAARDEENSCNESNCCVIEMEILESHESRTRSCDLIRR